MTKKEFDLSDWIRQPIKMTFKDENMEGEFKAKTTFKVIRVENIRKFIRLLKEEMKGKKIGKLYKVIDKLAGKGLI